MPFCLLKTAQTFLWDEEDEEDDDGDDVDEEMELRSKLTRIALASPARTSRVTICRCDHQRHKDLVNDVLDKRTFGSRCPMPRVCELRCTVWGCGSLQVHPHIVPMTFCW